MNDRDQTYIDFQVDNTREKIKVVADNLRRIADEVEREAAFKEGCSNHAVSQVIHAVVWGTANLNLDVLVDAEHRIQEAKDVSREEPARVAGIPGPPTTDYLTDPRGHL